MSTVRLKIDVSGTVGDEAWREIKQFDQIQSADFGPQFGSGGRRNDAPDRPTPKATGSEPKSGYRRRFWRSMRFRIIWSRSACWMPMSWSRSISMSANPIPDHH